MRAYLCGAIEYSPDQGRGWRRNVAAILESVGHECYDPAEDERKNLDEEELANFRAWKLNDLPRFQKAVRKIIAWDLDQIEHQADYLICFWDEYAGKGAGSQGEITFAHRHGIPVYMVLGLPREQVSGWLLGCASEVFEDFGTFESFMRNKYATAEVQG